jgi:phosphotriesterase-related protein
VGVCFGHEHLIVDHCHLTGLHPDFLLDDVECAVREVAAARALGLTAVVDAMPLDVGRNPRKLAAVARRTGLHIVMATGLHVAPFYPADHWRFTEDAEAQAKRFIADILDGCEGDEGPVRSGLIKVGASTPRPVGAERVAFEAAAVAQLATGAPILVHTPGGRGGLVHVELLASAGVPPDRVALSHVDRARDVGYLCDLLDTGATCVLDQASRATDGTGTAELVAGLAARDRLAGVVLGLDHGRRRYWAGYERGPGLTFLLTSFRARLASLGLGEEVLRRLLVRNPRRAFALAPPGPPGERPAGPAPVPDPAPDPDRPGRRS